MALKRLDEEFDLKPGTQLLPYMRRLLPSLEGRFQALETERKSYELAVAEVRAVALQRINEILIPASEDIVEVTTLGFLLGPSTSSVILELGVKVFTITEGPQRETFTPSPYVIVEHVGNIDNYAIARVQYYTRETGALSLLITAVHGAPGPHNDWVISSTPGMADSTKLYHDAVAPMAQQVAADKVEVDQARDEVVAAAAALAAAGLDAQAFIRRDGTVPFIAIQRGVTPTNVSNDTTLATTAWARARIAEFTAFAVQRTGDTMTGPLHLAASPTAPTHAVTKAYADGLTGNAHWINDYVGVRGGSPVVYLQTTSTGQNRMVEGRSPGGVVRWQMMLGDATAESGGNAGSDFALHRYSDVGAYLGGAFSINRQTGAMSLPGRLNVSGGAGVVGNIDLFGDLNIYRPGTPTTGVIYLNQAKTAYHYYDGARHRLEGGGVTAAGSIECHALSCHALTTNGNPATVWGLTSHGAAQINGQLTVNGGLFRMTGLNYNTIEFHDTDWGTMYLHHNGDLIGFLNNGGGWLTHFTNAGHLWTAQYGWIHDYVWGAANSAAANAVAGIQSGATSIRMVHAGDHQHWWHTGMEEPFGGAVVTGATNDGWNGGMTDSSLSTHSDLRLRHLGHGVLHLKEAAWTSSITGIGFCTSPIRARLRRLATRLCSASACWMTRIGTAISAKACTTSIPSSSRCSNTRMAGASAPRPPMRRCCSPQTTS